MLSVVETWRVEDELGQVVGVSAYQILHLYAVGGAGFEDADEVCERNSAIEAVDLNEYVVQSVEAWCSC